MSTTTTETMVEISDGIKVPERLILELGYIDEHKADEHCGHDIDAAYKEGEAAGRASATQAPDSPSAIVMERWHNEHHEGVYRLCYEQPCLDLRKAGDAYP